MSTCSCYRLLCDVLCIWDILWPADESEALEGCLAFLHREHLRALQPEPEAEPVSLLTQAACAPLYSGEPSLLVYFHALSSMPALTGTAIRRGAHL
jgi:hypothetical protein